MKTRTKRALQISIPSLFFFAIIVYALLGSHSLIIGVKIKEVNLENGARVSSAVQEIKGNAKNASTLTLNGREISLDQNGDFSETVVLLSGYNIINITAEDKFGDSDEKNYQIIYGEGDTF